MVTAATSGPVLVPVPVLTDAVEALFASPLAVEIPSAEALNSKTAGSSDTYTEED